MPSGRSWRGCSACICARSMRWTTRVADAGLRGSLQDVDVVERLDEFPFEPVDGGECALDIFHRATAGARVEVLEVRHVGADLAPVDDEGIARLQLQQRDLPRLLQEFEFRVPPCLHA